MTGEALQILIGAGTLMVAVLSLVISAVAVLMTRRRVTLEDKRDIESRLSIVETQLKYAPQRDEIHQLTHSISHLTGQLDATREKIDGMGNLISRLENWAQRHEDLVLGKSHRG